MNSHMDFIKEQLYALTGIPSPSGFTKKVTDYLLSELTALGFAPEKRKCFCHSGRLRLSACTGCPCRHPGCYGALHQG